MRKLNAVPPATVLLALGLRGRPADGAKNRTLVVTSFFDDTSDGCSKIHGTLREAIIGGTNVDTCDGGPGKDKLLNCE